MRYAGIDPSTNTGLVILNGNGEPIYEGVIKGDGDIDPLRMRTMIDRIVDKIDLGDFVLIEGFGFSSIQAVMNGGQGWGIRMLLDYHSIGYTEVAPLSVKKFVGAQTHYGDKGHKKRFVKGKVKKEMARATLETLGYSNKNNNITDAYVIAYIGYAMNNPYLWPSFNAAQMEVLNLLLGKAG